MDWGASVTFTHCDVVWPFLLHNLHEYHRSSILRGPVPEARKVGIAFKAARKYFVVMLKGSNHFAGAGVAFAIFLLASLGVSDASAACSRGSGGRFPAISEPNRASAGVNCVAAFIRRRRRQRTAVL